jgi:hypothetical protein
MDQRVAPDRELGQVVDALRLGAAARVVPIPAAARTSRPTRGTTRTAMTFERIGAVRSMDVP